MQCFSLIIPPSLRVFLLKQFFSTAFPKYTSPSGKQGGLVTKWSSFPFITVTCPAFHPVFQSAVLAMKTGRAGPRLTTGVGELSLHNVSGLLSSMMTARGACKPNTSGARRRWRLRQLGIVRFKRRTELDKFCAVSQPTRYESVSYTHLTLPTKRIV